MLELILIVVFLLAMTIDPFKGESHDPMIEILHTTEVAAHSIVAYEEVYRQTPPGGQFLLDFL